MKKNSSENLWALILFASFMLFSFYLILLGANNYKRIVIASENDKNFRIPLSYVATTLRQNDSEDVSLGVVDGTQCLLIEHDNYQTIIYYYDGYLNELTVKNDAKFGLADGEKIIELDYFEISESNNGYLCTATIEDKEHSMLITMR